MRAPLSRARSVTWNKRPSEVIDIREVLLRAVEAQGIDIISTIRNRWLHSADQLQWGDVETGCQCLFVTLWSGRQSAVNDASIWDDVDALTPDPMMWTGQSGLKRAVRRNWQDFKFQVFTFDSRAGRILAVKLDYTSRVSARFDPSPFETWSCSIVRSHTTVSMKIHQSYCLWNWIPNKLAHNWTWYIRYYYLFSR